jgi:hypothetical protein
MNAIVVEGTQARESRARIAAVPGSSDEAIVSEEAGQDRRSSSPGAVHSNVEATSHSDKTEDR